MKTRFQAFRYAFYKPSSTKLTLGRFSESKKHAQGCPEAPKCFFAIPSFKPQRFTFFLFLLCSCFIVSFLILSPFIFFLLYCSFYLLILVLLMFSTCFRLFIFSFYVRCLHVFVPFRISLHFSMVVSVDVSFSFFWSIMS